MPKIDVLFSGVLTSSPGLPLRADWTVSNALIQPSLGRPLSNSAPNVVVNLLKPDDLRSERVNEVDLRIAKILRFGRTRANVALDLLNAFNLSTILPRTRRSSGGAWRRRPGRRPS